MMWNSITKRPNRINKTVLTVLLLAFLFNLRAAHASEPHMKVGMVTDRAEYWVGEPVVLRCRIVNWFAPFLFVRSSMELGGDSDLRIVREGEPGDRYWANQTENPVSAPPKVMNYGKAIEFYLTVLYSTEEPNGLALPKPGEYWFELSQTFTLTNMAAKSPSPFSVRSHTASSKIVIVAPPANAKGALDLLLANSAALIDLQRMEASPASQWVLEKIATEYPDSHYAPYCVAALASYATNLAGIQVAQRPIAQKYIDEIVNKWPDFPLRHRIDLLQLTLYTESDQVDKAVDYLWKKVGESEDNLFRFIDNSLVTDFVGGKNNIRTALNRPAWELFDVTEFPDAYVQIVTGI
jgi:hypothetical protein